MKKFLKWASFILLGLLFLAILAGWWVHEPRPEGYGSAAEADSLARAMQMAVDDSAWDETGAVRWTFAGMNRHLWDRERSLAQVEWENVRVLVELGTQRGVAFVDGARADTGEEAELVKAAWAKWVNDSFWLNPIGKLFDEGTTRQLMRWEDGSEGLLISYRSGGTTPGDAYGWKLRTDGRPMRWKMWVSVIPIGGLEASWEGWQQLQTGVWVATQHQMGPVTLEMTELEGAATLEQLMPGKDPFAPLFR